MFSSVYNLKNHAHFADRYLKDNSAINNRENYFRGSPRVEKNNLAHPIGSAGSMKGYSRVDAVRTIESPSHDVSVIDARCGALSQVN